MHSGSLSKRDLVFGLFCKDLLLQGCVAWIRARFEGRQRSAFYHAYAAAEDRQGDQVGRQSVIYAEEDEFWMETRTTQSTDPVKVGFLIVHPNFTNQDHECSAGSRQAGVYLGTLHSAVLA